MTLAEFKELPGLITRKEFMRLTGLDHRVVNLMVKAGSIRVWRPDFAGQGKGKEFYARYYTIEAARLCGIDLVRGEVCLTTESTERKASGKGVRRGQR